MFIKIRHPELGLAAEVDEAAFDLIYSRVGWERTVEGEQPSHELPSDRMPHYRKQPALPPEPVKVPKVKAPVEIKPPKVAEPDPLSGEE